MEQRSAIWFETRKKFLGASDSPILMNVSPWKTPHDLFLDKTSPYVEVASQNPYMQRGLDLEPEALLEFEKQTDYLMTPKVLFSEKHIFMMASLDGLSIDGDVACEIKCPGEKDHLQACFGDIPEKYYPQLQHQMEVAGLDMIYYVSYRPEYELEPLVIKEVKRDQAYIDKLIEVERTFYEEHMLTGIPPENPKKMKKIESPIWLDIANEYRKMDTVETEAKKRKEELKDMMIQLSDSENACGNGIILQKIERKGIINYQNIPEIKQMDLEKYRKPGSSYWQVKESNE